MCEPMPLRVLETLVHVDVFRFDLGNFFSKYFILALCGCSMVILIYSSILLGWKLNPLSPPPSLSPEKKEMGVEKQKITYSVFV